MRYQVEVLIDRPRDEVVAVFADPEQAKDWIPGLLRIEPVEGEPGANGSKTRFYFKTRRGEMNMVETITDNSLYSRHGVYLLGLYEDHRGFHAWRLSTGDAPPDGDAEETR